MEAVNSPRDGAGTEARRELTRRGSKRLERMPSLRQQQQQSSSQAVAERSFLSPLGSPMRDNDASPRPPPAHARGKGQGGGQRDDRIHMVHDDGSGSASGAALRGAHGAEMVDVAVNLNMGMETMDMDCLSSAEDAAEDKIHSPTFRSAFSASAVVTTEEEEGGGDDDGDEEHGVRLSRASPPRDVDVAPLRMYAYSAHRLDESELKPYPHQVGGHGPLSRVCGRVLKPLHRKEYVFYETLWLKDAPKEIRWMRDFCPQYFGKYERTTQSGRARRELGHTAVPASPESGLVRKSTALAMQRIALQNEQVEPPNPDAPCVENLEFPGAQPNAGGADGDSTPLSTASSQSLRPVSSIHRTGSSVWKTVGAATQGKGAGLGEEVGMSPWAGKMRELYSATEAASNNIFIQIADVNARFTSPCVLDLKIGRRHYDDDAPEEKVRRHIEKSKNTTSHSVGIRFTGMQVYNAASGTFLFYDKYRGRSLKPEDLMNEFSRFFSNGQCVRYDAIRVVVERLRILFEKMQKQTLFRFYSSSVLIVYEGDLDAVAKNDHLPVADVKMIDFAHTQHNDDRKVDEGYLFGLHNLIQILIQLLERERRTTQEES
ncbi:Inositol hexakisphosphate kinase 3 [Porphyridium purpureum]|uniref:Kinase n=1 Tax=Porphyridium purpureum TaxID=35688 RepID=A0A5J4Z081_PORPP|nr:Inositol hexakisphosphate kinase 3 [Porphyridium purpureum]|eukprot:POR2265..scf209_3